MRELPIAYGNSRHARNWVNKKISYGGLKERLRVTIRTTESAEEYAGMAKSRRDDIKDHGGFVGGILAGGRRKTDSVIPVRRRSRGHGWSFPSHGTSRRKSTLPSPGTLPRCSA